VHFGTETVPKRIDSSDTDLPITNQYRFGSESVPIGIEQIGIRGARCQSVLIRNRIQSVPIQMRIGTEKHRAERYLNCCYVLVPNWHRLAPSSSDTDLLGADSVPFRSQQLGYRSASVLAVLLGSESAPSPHRSHRPIRTPNRVSDSVSESVPSTPLESIPDRSGTDSVSELDSSGVGKSVSDLSVSNQNSNRQRTGGYR